MMMPNFFIVGAQKAGTTSLYHYLKQHPQVYMSPIKEPFFFNHELNTKGEVVRAEFGGPSTPHIKFANIGDYRTLFQGVSGEKAIGEASVLYIYAPGTAERIKRYVPEARVIALLRNPADRAYSAFLHAVRIGREPHMDFAQALQEEDDRIRNNWHYLFHYRNRGLYHAQLERYYEVFGKEKVGLWLYEDLSNDPVGVVQSALRFLGVDDTFTPDISTKHNPARVPKGEIARFTIRFMNTALPVVGKAFPPASEKFRQLVNSRILAESPSIDPKIRKELIEGYKEDIMKLQELIGRDLSGWLR